MLPREGKRNETLEDYQTAADIHRNVRKYIQPLIKPGVNLKDLCNLLENKTRELTEGIGGIAFPTGYFLNSCAAHFTPNPLDEVILKESDILKIDFGVHVNGHLIESAFTWTFNDNYKQLKEPPKKRQRLGSSTPGRKWNSDNWESAFKR